MQVRAFCYTRESLRFFAAMKRRGVQVNQDLSARRLGLSGRLRVPNILTDCDAHLPITQGDHTRAIAGREIALLIKYLIVRQALLVIFGDQLAVLDDPRCVEKCSIASTWVPDNGNLPGW